MGTNYLAFFRGLEVCQCVQSILHRFHQLNTYLLKIQIGHFFLSNSGSQAMDYVYSIVIWLKWYQW